MTLILYQTYLIIFRAWTWLKENEGFTKKTLCFHWQPCRFQWHGTGMWAKRHKVTDQTERFNQSWGFQRPYMFRLFGFARLRPQIHASYRALFWRTKNQNHLKESCHWKIEVKISRGAFLAHTACAGPFACDNGLSKTTRLGAVDHYTGWWMFGHV